MNYSHLTTEERYTIEKLNARGENVRAIAEALERAPSTVSRELRRYGQSKVYNAQKASRKAKKRRKNCSNGARVSSIVKHYIRSKLKLLWSPEQIAGTLRLRKKELRLQLVSARWIYSFIRLDKKTGGILYTYLRCQKKRRKRYRTGLSKRGESRTLTLDNGKEFACHRAIAKKLGIDVYFARPYASYERGTNENTDGLVRQCLPKQKSFATITQIDLNRFQKILNHRPRKSLNFLTPHEMLIRSIK